MTSTPTQPRTGKRCPVPRDVGRRLRDLRSARKLSLTEVAARVGTTHQHLSRIETGKVNTPIIMLAQLAAAFDIPLAELFLSTSCPETSPLEQVAV